MQLKKEPEKPFIPSWASEHKSKHQLNVPKVLKTYYIKEAKEMLENFVGKNDD